MNKTHRTLDTHIHAGDFGMLQESQDPPVPIEKYHMHPGFVVEIPLNAEPVDTITVKDADGSRDEVPIHGFITFAKGEPDAMGQGTRFGFSIQDTEVGWYRFDAQGHISERKETIDYGGSRSSVFAKASPVLLSRGFIAPNKDSPEPKLALSVKMSQKQNGTNLSQDESLPSIEARARTLTMEPANDLYTFLQKKNRAFLDRRSSVSKVRSVGKKMLAAFGLYAAVHSGGLVDRALDPFQDAGQAIEQTLQSPNSYHDKSLLRPADDAQYASQPVDYNKLAQQKYDETADRIADVMRDWDAGDLGAIHAKAQAYRERNKDKLMDKEQVANLKERVEAATTHEEVVQVADEFMRFYDKRATFWSGKEDASTEIGPFDPTIDVATTKAFTQGLINAFSPLSKDILGWGKFKEVVLGEGSGHVVGAYFASGDGKLGINVSAFGGFSALTSEIQGHVNPENPEHNVLHEFAHSMHPPKTGAHEQANRAVSVVEYLGRKIIGYPNEASLYSVISPDHEKDAENLAIALDVHGKFGLASPNETRRFSSPANQSALVMAQDMERRYRQEGLTAYLVDEQINNKRQALLGRK